MLSTSRQKLSQDPGGVATPNHVLLPHKVLRQVKSAHKPVDAPKFGGELEVMFVHAPDDDGHVEPVGYASEPGKVGMEELFSKMTASGTHHSVKDIEGQDILLHGKDGSVMCFENYACVVERADRAYGGPSAFDDFVASIDQFTASVDAFAAEHDLCVSPFDFDIFCDKKDFEGKNAPSERFGEEGLLSAYDAAHPLTDDIDRRTTSSHFSVGYKDFDHLWRQIKIMTVLTPAIYASFASSPPTVECEVDGQKTILPKKDALDRKANGDDIKIGEDLLVPRARLWSLMDADRTGIDTKLAELVCADNSSFNDYVDMILDKEAICFGEKGQKQSFRDHVKSQNGTVFTNDYMKHVSTLWYDVRIDLLRLEARSAGNAAWKSKSIGALLTTILLNDEVMEKVEKVIDDLNLSPQDILSARHDVASRGLATTFGDKGVEIGHVMKKIVDIASEALMEKGQHQHIAPLADVLRTGKTDSDILAELYDTLGGDYTSFLNIPYAEVEPFVTMQTKGKIAAPAAAISSQKLVQKQPGKA